MSTTMLVLTSIATVYVLKKVRRLVMLNIAAEAYRHCTKFRWDTGQCMSGDETRLVTAVWLNHKDGVFKGVEINEAFGTICGYDLVRLERAVDAIVGRPVFHEHGYVLDAAQILHYRKGLNKLYKKEGRLPWKL